MSSKHALNHVDFLDFDPLKISEQRWGLYYQFIKTMHKQRYPGKQLETSLDTVKKGLQSYADNPEVLPVMFSIIDSAEDVQIGHILCVIPREQTDTFKESPEYMEFYVNILQNYHRRGIGTKALSKIHEVARTHNKSLLATDTYYPSGKAFLQAMDADLEIGLENRLDLTELDWDMVEQWITESEEKSPETTLVALNLGSDKYLEQFSTLYTETYNQQPVDGVEEVAITFSPEYIRHRMESREELGIKNFILLTVEDNDEVSGLTEVVYNPEFKTMVTQGLTGVKEKHRGRGLGKWLKAAMLLRIKDELPQVNIVRTENVTTNAPMLSINNRLGFQFFRESIEAQITIEKLTVYLKRSGYNLG